MPEHMIALVTGANKGIGREIASQLAVLGHTLIVGARDAAGGEQTAGELPTAGGDVTSVVLDVTDQASVETAAGSVRARYGRLDALVNAVCPGFVATDLNGFRGTRSTTEGAVQAVRMATIPADGPTGTFTDDDGPVPW